MSDMALRLKKIRYGFAALSALLLVLVLLPAVQATPAPRGCPDVMVRGAEHSRTACLPDLTTAALSGTQYTDVADWMGLHAPGTVNPRGVPGVQVDGYFPDTSRTNPLHGWDHDSQFVIRLPQRWNGKLVVTGAPGTRRQYAMDFAISDWVLARGYAFASTDKGNGGTGFYLDGKQPGDAIDEWNTRMTELTRAAKRVVKDHYGRHAARTYITGASNGGYLTRWQLENHPELYDGGVDWEGVLWSRDRTTSAYLPTAVAYSIGLASRQDMLRVGFPARSEPLWPYHQVVYWGATAKYYRAEIDPTYDRQCPGTDPPTSVEEILAPCPSDADYVWADRPARVHQAIKDLSLTGKIGKPMLTLHGTLDSLLLAQDSRIYTSMIARAGRGHLHRYYEIADGNHVDSLYSSFPTLIRPLLPCQRTAFDALVGWVERGVQPPASKVVAKPRAGDILNTCRL